MKFRYKNRKIGSYFIYDVKKDEWFGYLTNASYKEVFEHKGWQSTFTEKQFEGLCKRFNLKESNFIKCEYY